MDKRTVTLLATVLALCANASRASVVGDGNATAVAAERAKTSAEKGDAVAQLRYAEVLRAGRGEAKNFLDGRCQLCSQCHMCRMNA